MLEPVGKSNAYYGYTESDEDIGLVAPNGLWDKEARQKARLALARLLDRVTGNCDRCRSQPSTFLWVPATEFKEKWWDFDPESLEASNPTTVPLCGGCALEAVLAAVEARHLLLNEIHPPVVGTVLMFSGES